MDTPSDAHLLDNIFTSLYGMVAYLDRDFNFIRVNEAYARADNKSPEAFIGKNHFDLYPNEENEAIFRQVVSSGEPYIAYQKPFDYPDQPERDTTYWNWNLTPVKNDRGEVEGLLLNLQEVTQFVRMEQALRGSQHDAQGLLNAITESALLIELDGTVSACNHTAAERLGTTIEEMVGRNMSEVLPTEIFQRRFTMGKEVVEKAEPRTVIDTRDGRTFRITYYPVLNDSGQPVRVAIYGEDITEDRLLENIERLFHAIDKRVLEGAEADQLLAQVCDELVQLCDFPVAWFGRKMPDGTIDVRHVAGQSDGYAREVERIGIRWDHSVLGSGPAGMAIRSGQFQAARIDDNRFHPWAAAAHQHGLRSALALPMTISGEVYGIIGVYGVRPDCFDNEFTIKRLSGIVDRLRVALDAAENQQQLRLLGSALSAAANAVMITTVNGKIVWINNAFEQLSGYSYNEVIGRSPRVLKSGKQSADYYKALWETILNGKEWVSDTIERHKDGSLYTVRQTVTPILGTNGKISHFIAIQEDITEFKKAQEKIQYLAHYDPLTDLPNRALFYDRLHQAIAVAKREKHRLALLFLDLDRFKAVNDEFGHLVGDALLQQVANRIRQTLRESDTVSRLGGDEFTVILPNVKGEGDTIIAARKIVDALSQPFGIDGHTIQSGTSIGIALYPEHGEDEDSLVRSADTAMYLVKRAGRGHVAVAGERTGPETGAE